MRKQLKRIYIIPVLIGMVIACSDYSVVAPTNNTEEFYWELNANHKAVLLSMEQPYNAIQLEAKPYTIHGNELLVDTLQDPVHIAWESSDTSTVHVTQTGLITAKKAATKVNVYVTVSVGQITHQDTIWVGVTQNAPSQLDSLIVFAPAGEDKVSAGGTLQLSVMAKLQNSQLVSDVPVSYRVSDRWLATFKQTAGLLYGTVPDDSVFVIATTTVYGVTMKDSIFLYTGWPVRQVSRAFSLESQMGNNNTVIFVPRVVDYKGGAGSTFRWENMTGYAPKNTAGFSHSGGMKIDVIFDNPELAEPFSAFLPPPYNEVGNILQLPYDTTRVDGQPVAYRKFTQPGDHYYTVQPLGVRGKVTISER